MKFKTTKSPQVIGVEDQDLVVKFCFAKQTQEELYENMTYWSECRDFMGDAVCGMADGKEKYIYGFKYNPKEKPLDMNHCIIGMRFPNAETQKTFFENVKFIEDFMAKFELPYVWSVRKFQGSPKTIAITLNNFWQQTTFNISFITFLLKSICWKLDTTKPLLEAIEESVVEGDYKTKEARYLLNGVKENLLKVLPNLVKLTNDHKYPHGYDIDKDVGTVHNRSGFNFNCRWTNQGTVITDWLGKNK